MILSVVLPLCILLFKDILTEKKYSIHSDRLGGTLNGGVNKGSVVVVLEMERTADNKNRCGYAPDFKNSTLNPGEHIEQTNVGELVKNTDNKTPF